MNDEISRRDWVALVTSAAVAPSAARDADAMGAVQDSAPVDRCPYFDQPLFCKGRKYCQ